MAATVHSGSNQNFSYTNNTGGNIRVIIGHVVCSTDDSSADSGIKMRFGASNSPYVFQVAGGTNQGFGGFGKHLTYIMADYAGGQSSGTGAAKGMFGYGKSNTCFCDEIWLADGESINIQAVNASYPLKTYNILTIPEGN